MNNIKNICCTAVLFDCADSCLIVPGYPSMNLRTSPSTSIDLHDTTASIQTALRVAKDFRINKGEALAIVEEVASAGQQWREVASSFGLTKRECDRMASAFVVEID